MTKDKDEPTVELSDQVKEQMAKDPELAAYMRDFSARARQALQGINEGKYEDFGSAMEAQGMKGERVDLSDLPEVAAEQLIEAMIETAKSKKKKDH